MRSARTGHTAIALWLLAASVPTRTASADRADAELGLADAVRQALEASLDLAAQRRALAADREEIPLARSTCRSTSWSSRTSV